MMAMYPEGVDMKRFSKEHWYSRGAVDASKEYGDKVLDTILVHLRACFKK